MTADKEVIRAARNMITEHGEAAEQVALARAKRATEIKRDELVRTWRQIAEAVRQMQERK